MTDKNGHYFRDLLGEKVLDKQSVNKIVKKLKKFLTLEDVPAELLASNAEKKQSQIIAELSELMLHVATGPSGWGGLVVGFPGYGVDLTTRNITAPYLRHVLYPIVDLHRRLNDHYGDSLPCLYLLGVWFPDVFLRKFRLLEHAIPKIIVLTPDLFDDVSAKGLELPEKVNEQWVQLRLREMMKEDEDTGLAVPVKRGYIHLEYLRHELSTTEGTVKREQLDVLAVDKADRSLVLFELKGPDGSRKELENLFFQALDYREWLEHNKLALKLSFEKIRGITLNTEKPVRMVLGFFGDYEPDLFWKLRRQVMEETQDLKIDFVRFNWEGEVGEKLVLARRIKPEGVHA